MYAMCQVVTVVSDVPEESCDIVPSKVCKSAAQLVPHLAPVETCSDLPRQICSFGVKSTTVTEKPLITKWCFDPAEEEEDLPRPPDFSGLDADSTPDLPPQLSPIEVEDVLVFEDNDGDIDGASRSGKKLGVLNKAKIKSVKNHVDPSLKSTFLFPKRIEGKTRVSEKFREINAQKIENTSGGEEGLGGHGAQQGDAAINEIESIGINRGDTGGEGRDVNKQFKAILSKLNSDFRSKIKIEKADSDNDHKNSGALAKIIKHKNSPVSHTILIKNTPEAHKIFGIKNPPSTPSQPGGSHFQDISSEILDFESKNENTPDLEFSDKLETSPMPSSQLAEESAGTTRLTEQQTPPPPPPPGAVLTT